MVANCHRASGGKNVNQNVKLSTILLNVFHRNGSHLILLIFYNGSPTIIIVLINKSGFILIKKTF